MSVPWSGDTVNRCVELSGMLGAGLGVFDEGESDDGDCEESG
jgi:hypothetical protein